VPRAPSRPARSRKPLTAFRWSEGSNPSPSATRANFRPICSHLGRRMTARWRARSRKRASANASSRRRFIPRHSPPGGGFPTTCPSPGACLDLRNRRSHVRNLTGALAGATQSHQSGISVAEAARRPVVPRLATLIPAVGAARLQRRWPAHASRNFASTGRVHRSKREWRLLQDQHRGVERIVEWYRGQLRRSRRLPDRPPHLAKRHTEPWEVIEPSSHSFGSFGRGVAGPPLRSPEAAAASANVSDAALVGMGALEATSGSCGTRVAEELADLAAALGGVRVQIPRDREDERLSPPWSRTASYCGQDLAFESNDMAE
jgi:hypothetical protein